MNGWQKVLALVAVLAVLGLAGAVDRASADGGCPAHYTEGL